MYLCEDKTLNTFYDNPQKRKDNQKLMLYYDHQINPEKLNVRDVLIGNIPLGKNHPVRIQSMTNTNTLDIERTVIQTQNLFDLGADFVRITTPSMKEANSLLEIRRVLHLNGYKKPIIADVHFKPEVAEFLAHHIEKVRINPGNYSDSKHFKQFEYTDAQYESEIQRIRDNILPLLKICKEKGTAIRVGVNYGSISDRIVSRYGNTPEAMSEAAMEFIRICVSESFHNIVVSLKASDLRFMIQSYRLLAAKMKDSGMLYPLHLGVTEAGNDLSARIKSAIGIGCLLSEGIGNTLRVSLSETPENEIPVAQEIIRSAVWSFPEKISEIQNFDSFRYHKRDTFTPENLKGGTNPFIIFKSDDKFSSKDADMVLVKKENELSGIYSYSQSFKKEKEEIKASSIILIDTDKDYSITDLRRFFNYLMERKFLQPVLFKTSNLSSVDHVYSNAILIGSLLVDGLGDGVILSCQKEELSNQIALLKEIYQSARARIFYTDFIACPTCGRTRFDFTTVFNQLKIETSHLTGLKIAMMGCIVNGPGEMADADYGCIVSGENQFHIYKGKEIIRRNVSSSLVIAELINCIKSGGDWREK